MKYSKITRRLFLQGVGGTFLALPLLESLFPSEAFAQAAAASRFIAIKSVNGQRKRYWNPVLPGGTGFTQVAPGVRHAPLSAFNSTGLNTVLGPSFVPYHPKMTFLEGLDIIPPLGHNPAGFLGNFNDSTATIDQVMAKSAKVYPQEPAIRSLLLGQGCSVDSSNGTLISLPAYHNPQAAFDRIFYSSNPAQKQRYTTVVDAVFADYQKLKGNKRLSANDRITVDRHLATVQELQNRLKNQAPLTCPSTPTRPAQGDPAGGALTDIEQYYKNMTDLIALSIMCGATRVAVLNVEYPKAYNGNDWHGPSHDREDSVASTLLEINQWIAQKIVLEVVKKLDVPEANGRTYLDNSVVMWGNEISIGWSHVNVNMPTVLFGSGGGRFATGKYISYVNPAGQLCPGGEQPYGRPYNQLLVSLLQMMGMSTADYERNGQPGYGAASALDKDRMAYYQPLLSQVGQPLPVLVA